MLNMEKNADGGAGKETRPLPQHIVDRRVMWDKLKKRYDEEVAVKPRCAIKITLPDGEIVDGKSWETTPFRIAAGISQELADAAIIAKVNCYLWDLDRPLEEDYSLQIITFDDPHGKEVFWHSSAHALREARERFYGGKLCGCPESEIANGFHYDMHVEGDEITSDDYGSMETIIKQITEEKQPFERLEISKADLLQMFGYNELKVKILNEIITEDTTTVYRCGTLIELCRGPHVRHTGKLNVIKLTKNSSEQWKNEADAEILLQRVHAGTLLQHVQINSFPCANQSKEWKKSEDFMNYVRLSAYHLEQKDVSQCIAMSLLGILVGSELRFGGRIMSILHKNLGDAFVMFNWFKNAITNYELCAYESDEYDVQDAINACRRKMDERNEQARLLQLQSLNPRRYG